jgi:hypothetical protein
VNELYIVTVVLGNSPDGGGGWGGKLLVLFNCKEVNELYSMCNSFWGDSQNWGEGVTLARRVMISINAWK